MKKIILGFAGLLLSAGLACGANMWGVNAAYWDTADAGDGFGAGTKFSFEMAPGAQLDLRASFFNSLGKDDVDLDVIPLEAGLALAYPVGGSVDLTAGGGIGYYLMDGSAGVPGEPTMRADPDNEAGFYLAAGIEWSLRSSGASFGETFTGLFAEVMYRSVSADNMKVESGETVRLGDADLDGLGVNLGIMIKW